MLFFYKFGNSFYKVITNDRWHIKSHQITSKFKIQNRQRTKENTRKISIAKEWEDFADLYKPILNRMMTTHISRVKYNFVAPLRES